MFQHSDTICAPATPAGSGAIAVVRLSGSGTTEALRALLGEASMPMVGRLERRVLVRPDKSASPLDEAMVVRFEAPNTYTGEDTAELHLHGSPVLVEMVLEVLTTLGIRIAEPGEFTLRAFQNGKKDLAQAEAVHDLVEANNTAGVSLALQQLMGSVSRALGPLEQSLLHLVSRLEAEIDFPEDVDEMPPYELSKELKSLLRQIEHVLEGYERAQLLRRGYRVVLVGAPNAGKSSLFNALLGRERAIVTEEAGTTRDFLEEHLQQRPLPVVLVDTAGLRAATSVAEQSGVERSQSQLEQANLVLFVVDPTSPWTELDSEIASRTDGKERRIVATHLDAAEDDSGVPLEVHHTVSCTQGTGVVELKQAILAAAGDAFSHDGVSAVIVSYRQKQAVLSTRKSVSRALDDLHALPVDILVSNLREGLAALYSVTGKGTIADSVLEEIFSSFCIGK